MMRVQKITFVDQGSQEADIVVTDGHYRCDAFAYPCTLHEGQVLSEPLSCFEVSGLMRSESAEDRIETVVGSVFGCKIIGIVDSLSRKTIRVGNLVFAVHYIPGDLVEGERVEFFSDRIDVIE